MMPPVCVVDGLIERASTPVISSAEREGLLFRVVARFALKQLHHQVGC